MTETMEQVADALRLRLGIPAIGSVESNHSSQYDGWLVSARGVRRISLIRRYDVDHRPGAEHVRYEARLLARELMEHLRDVRIATHASRAFAQLGAAGHYGDPALVLAIAAREAGPRGVITTSSTHRNTYSQGGADDAWGRRNQLALPPAVRRRLRPASAVSNEAGRPVRPALIPGHDQLILYAAYTHRARRQLETQVVRVFGDFDAQLRMLEWSTDARRAWTQLSFGRGGGGGLLRALRRVKDENATLESIFTDRVMVRADSVKRARVTAADAALIHRFVLRGTRVGGAVAREGVST